MTFEEFRCLLSDNFGIDKNLVKKNTSLTNDLGIDSLSIVNFVVKLEKKFNVRYNINNLWELKDVEEAYKMLIVRIGSSFFVEI